MFVKHCKVEVYLLELNLCENDNMDNVVTRHFSKADTIGMVTSFSFRFHEDFKRIVSMTIVPLSVSIDP